MSLAVLLTRKRIDFGVGFNYSSFGSGFGFTIFSFRLASLVSRNGIDKETFLHERTMLQELTIWKLRNSIRVDKRTE